MTRKIIHIIGGGTLFHTANHLAICAPAYGTTARTIARLCQETIPNMETRLHLTRMADPCDGYLETWEDIRDISRSIALDGKTKIVFFNPALVDFSLSREGIVPGKYTERLRTSDTNGNQLSYPTLLTPLPKILPIFRQGDERASIPARKDILLVGFKTTCGESEEVQYLRALEMMKRSSCNLVLANDTKTRVNMIVVPEEAAYCVTTDREKILQELVEMAHLRSHLTFTRSTVVEADPVSWESELVPEALRVVVDHCIDRGAYRRFLGVTAGHFAVKLSNTEFLTSRRRTDFNDMKRVGLVQIRTDGPDSVIAYGSKPSVGGQSQRIIFGQHPEYDCIVHFHCPIRPHSEVPIVSQREFECGSHECGKNTSDGLRRFGNLSSVYLNNHGPNIVFHSSTNPQEVIHFIETNFDLSQKTGGYQI